MSNDPKYFDYSHLSISERISLAQELWESVYDQLSGTPLTASQRRKLERRWSTYKAGDTKTSTWEEVKQRLRET